ncbi:uncharacterized protein LOC111054155 isoform X3 [Nilaparvata lugens]|nr:uncharacterized protein LOC111054155 isoform X3 [Nilaparvata lugens]XP_039294607.1 uncharacterized protein LOC111054155 isoform X3 [Nilaparvata lugens]
MSVKDPIYKNVGPMAHKYLSTKVDFPYGIHYEKQTDRTRAAIWLQKLRGITNDDQKKLRNEHLKLLLFALHRRSMLSVFEKPPPEELESFHDGLTLLEMTRELIELTEKKHAGGDSTGECPLPPVSTNVSADLKEYCASQSIPKFGAHVYYAVSNEPIQMWSKSPNCVYPAISDVPNPLQWELTLSKLTDHVLEKQAEAERLAAEAAHDDKTEEKDNTQVLPMIDVAVCNAPGSNRFKWKPDSILTLHQNYDFSDVGVAEDLEVQGKWQLELDEMAFSILDHSLPGRQRVVVRDPYYKGLPPDIAERRNHGVIDEVEVESTSSSEMDSMMDSQQISAMSAKKNLFTGKFKDVGAVAQQYLSANSDFQYGIHYDETVGDFRCGKFPMFFEGDDVVIDYYGEALKVKGSVGMWRLLTQDVTSVGEQVIYTDEEWMLYMELLMRSNEVFEEEKAEIAKFNAPGGGKCVKKMKCCCCGKSKKKTVKGPGGCDGGRQGPGGFHGYEGNQGGPGGFQGGPGGFNPCGVGQDDITATYFGLGALRDKAAEYLPSWPKLEWPKLRIGLPNLGMPSWPSWPSWLKMPSLGFSFPDLGFLKFWKVFEKPETLYLKALDYLIRRLLDVENLRKASKLYCVATANCLVYWIIEYMIALMGTDGGIKKCLDWSMINEPLIMACDLLNKIVYELKLGPPGEEKPVCDLQKIFENQACSLEEKQKYEEFMKEDDKFLEDLKNGVLALGRIFADDASYFEKAGALVTLSRIGFSAALKAGVDFIRYLFNW